MYLSSSQFLSKHYREEIREMQCDEVPMLEFVALGPAEQAASRSEVSLSGPSQWCGLPVLGCIDAKAHFAASFNLDKIIGK